MLETFGVPVIAVGQDEFPAFWSRSSGLHAPLRLDTAAEIAAAHLMRRHLGLPGGQLVANPIPVTAEIPREVITPCIETALAEAKAQGIAAKAGDAIPPAAHLRTHEWPLARGEHRPRAEQRPARRGHRDRDQSAGSGLEPDSPAAPGDQRAPPKQPSSK